MRPLALILFLLLPAAVVRAQSSAVSSSSPRTSPAKPASASPPVATAGSLALEAATDREFYMMNSGHEVYLEVKVVAGAAAVPGGETTRRNFVFVLDRSASMAGERMQALRQALDAVLANISATDTVAIVAFDSEVETLVEAGPRGELTDLAAVFARMEPTGGSALYDALNQGAAQLRRNAGPAVSSHLVLVTDGPPTKGPRDAADFAKLAGVFADEKITISTIGLGDEFNEDLLANLARIAHGRFWYAAQPAQLAAALQAGIAPASALIARDVTVTVEILSSVNELESYGWTPAAVKDRKAMYQLPYVFAGQEIPLFLGARTGGRFGTYRFARLQLAWTQVSDGQPQQLEKIVSVNLDPDSSFVAKSANPALVPRLVTTVIGEGLEKAIEQIDKGNFRNALRELRRARSVAADFNDDLEAPAAVASIAALDAYLAEVQPRGLNASDRKVLRSGLNNRFDPPVPEEKAKP